jgi:hypothetical protein
MNSARVELPRFFDLLSSEDIEKYQSLQSVLSSSDCRNNRNQRLDKFQEMLGVIREFCERFDDGDADRFLACGVCPLEGCVAINIRQLHVLLGKCKSSINGSFQRMGSATVALKGPVLDAFLARIPQLKSNYNEIREWSVRTFTSWPPRSATPAKVPQMSPVPGAPVVITPPPSLGQIDGFCLGGERQSHEDNVWMQRDDVFCLTPSFFEGDYRFGGWSGFDAEL